MENKETKTILEIKEYMIMVLKIVRDESLVKDNRIVWGDVINGDVDGYPI